MIFLRLFNLYRRAGNGPCIAFRLARAALRRSTTKEIQ